MLIPFATQSYKSPALKISAQRCVNAFAEQEPPDAKTPVAVFVQPGLRTFATCGTGPIRGMHIMDGILYVVSGQDLYSVSSAGVATVVGGAVTGTGVVSMADNGTQLCIVNGTNGYIYTVATGFTLISDIDFHAANTVEFFDNVFVFDWIGTNKFFISDTLDGTSYDGLGFGTAEVQSDFVLCTVNQQENLLIFGASTIETWYNAGAVNMPFLRVDGGTIERGLIAPLSTVKEDNSVFFLGDDRNYYRLNIITPVRVSTHAIEEEWATYSTMADAFSFSYTYGGHKFVVLVFPTANKTWKYDISTNLWHEGESWDINGNSLGRWRGNCHIDCYNQNLIGDAFSGKIGALDATVFTEFDQPMRALMTSPPLHNDRKRVFVSRFELDMETGVGLNTGQGSDPQAMLRWSKDGGRTFSAQQIWQTIGRIGQYLTRLRWLRLGQGREWIFELTISDPVQRVVVSAHADVDVGM